MPCRKRPDSGRHTSATSTYVYAGGPLELDRSGTTYWYVGDSLGSIRMVADASGNTPATYNYSAFGSVRTSTGNLGNEILFAGARTDAETGLQYLNARTYDPGNGTFLQRDTLGAAAGDTQSAALYAYTQNDPANAVDPSGHSETYAEYMTWREGVFTNWRNNVCPWARSSFGVGLNCGGGSSSGGATKAAPNPAWPSGLSPYLGDLANFLGAISNAIAGLGPIKDLSNWITSHPREAQLACAAIGLAMIAVAAPELAGGILAGAIWGGAQAAGFYGLGCITGQECTAGGFQQAVLEGAVVGGSIGALASAFGGLFEESAGARGLACSFTPDTSVAMADGTSVPISRLRPGDIVLAYDPSTGKTGPHTVTAVMVNRDPATEHLVLDKGPIETTPNHLFYTADRGWVQAGALRIGEKIRTATGTDATVVSFTLDAHPASMWDITVEGAHSFFVGSGAALVHNCPKDFVPLWGAPSDASRYSGAGNPWALGRDIVDAQQGGFGAPWRIPWPQNLSIPMPVKLAIPAGIIGMLGVLLRQGESIGEIRTYSPGWPPYVQPMYEPNR